MFIDFNITGKKGFFKKVFSISTETKFTNEEYEKVGSHFQQYPNNIDIIIYKNNIDFIKFYSKTDGFELREITIEHLLHGINFEFESGYNDVNEDDVFHNTKELIRDMYDKLFHVISKYDG